MLIPYRITKNRKSRPANTIRIPPVIQSILMALGISGRKGRAGGAS